MLKSKKSGENGQNIYPSAVIVLNVKRHPEEVLLIWQKLIKYNLGFFIGIYAKGSVSRIYCLAWPITRVRMAPENIKLFLCYYFEKDKNGKTY